jgi:hypothetical protein
VQTIPSIDLYRELEVDSGATAETIDAAWKSLVKRHHPDVVADPQAIEKIKRLNLAHDWLSDPQLRARYDVGRYRAERGLGAGPNPGPATGPVGLGSRAEDPAAHDRPVWSTTAAGSGTGQPADPTHLGAANMARSGRLRTRALIVPALMIGTLLLAAAASYALAERPPASGASAATPAVAVGESPSPAGSRAAGTIGDPRLLKPPDVGADLPTTCRSVNQSRPFTFSTQVNGADATVVVAPCGADRSYGPLVYVSTSGRWSLKVHGLLQKAIPYQAFSGPISGHSPDEFGIAWTTGDGSVSYLELYRVGSNLTTFWDSRTVHLTWALAKYSYAPAADPTRSGSLTVLSADLSTGTCTACHDHVLYQETYSWSNDTGKPGLTRTYRQPAGVGP